MESSLNVSNLGQVAEIELTYKTRQKVSLLPKIITSKDAYKVLLDDWDMDKIEFVEQFKVLLLNRANRVLGVFIVSTGGVTSTIADPKIIFSAAIKSNACSIVLAHNHSSSNTKPSQEDINLTRKIKEGGDLLDIKILDHVIVTLDSYYSFADEGML